MENIIVGLVIALAVIYLLVKAKNMIRPGGGCGG